MSRFHIFFFLVAGILLLAPRTDAQVQSGAYRVMLQKLLSHTVPEITVPELVRDSGNVLLLDAREPREYEVSHLSGALLVGYDQYDSTIVATIDKNRPIVVYCSVGYRSEKIAERLIAAGFTKVSNMVGGIFEWVNQGHRVVNTQGTTKRVHAYDRIWGVWLQKGKKVY